jgi:hypothetical protein
MERNFDFYVLYPYYTPEYMEDIIKRQGLPIPTSGDSEAYFRALREYILAQQCNNMLPSNMIKRVIVS